jgi:hypothetical protein
MSDRSAHTAVLPATPTRTRDSGTILVLALVVIVLTGLIAIPIGGYAMAVTRSGSVVNTKARHVESAKIGLRVALADPQNLYEVCNAAGLTVGVNLPMPTLEESVVTTCYKMDELRSEAEGVARIGATTTLVGSSVPAGLFGDPFPGSGASPPDAWQSETTTDATDGKIWLPHLPSRALNIRSPAGHLMPAGYPACRVYFPGTYIDPITITSSVPTYFTSGVYYFTRPVRISGAANVVFGAGTVEGCTSDQEAAFYATDAPKVHNITGMGATMVMGETGRLTVDTATAGASISVVVNKRYVAPQEAGVLASAGISVMTVSGAMSGGSSTDLVVPSQLDVPRSMVAGSPAVPFENQGYNPSTLIPGSPTPNPVVSVDLTDNRTVQVVIPDYIAVPQGTVSVSTSAAATANKNIRIDGGVVAAQLLVSANRPAQLTMGLINPVVQRVLQIVSVSAGSPGAVSTAIVQVNENGAYAVNSWEVQ